MYKTQLINNVHTLRNKIEFKIADKYYFVLLLCLNFYSDCCLKFFDNNCLQDITICLFCKCYAVVTAGF